MIIELSETAELIYEIALTAKKQSEESNINSQILLLKTLQKAINHPIHGPKWKKVIENELAALISFNI